MPELENKTLEKKELSWKEIQQFKFNDLKEVKNRDVSKLKQSILNRGFFSPFIIWKDYVIDGAGRYLAIKELEKEGYRVPDLPCQFVQANNLAEAKIYALQMSSKHGEITQESLYEFTVDIPEVENLTDEVEFYEFNMEFANATEIQRNLNEKLPTQEKKNKKPLQKGHILLSVELSEFGKLAEEIQKIVDKNNNIEYEVAAN